MGTRADFYIGQGKDAEWLGSVAWDGYQWDNEGEAFSSVRAADEFRAAVEKVAKTREDFTAPSDGWPWPWNDSATTDYAYALIDGKVVASVFGGPWLALGAERGDDEPAGDAPDFPDMTSRKNVTFGKRSGVIVLGA